MTLAAWLRWDVAARLIPDGIDSVVEMGTGQAGIGVRLASDYHYTGFEPDEKSFGVAALRLGRLGSGTLHNKVGAGLAADETPVDMLVAFEVLEHLENDLDELTRWVTWVKPGGSVLLSVPAHRRRFSPADRAVGHFRRYDRDDLLALVRGAGLRVVALRSYGFPLLMATEAIRARVAKRQIGHSDDRMPLTDRSGRYLQPGERTGWITETIALPFRLLQRPFENGDLGTGFVIHARRPHE
jgi:hypothetical protein